VPGLVLVAIGIFFEATADEQLRRFIANPATRGTTLNAGTVALHPTPELLRRRARVERLLRRGVLEWLGLADDPLAVVMIYLLTSLSGKPMLERSSPRPAPATTSNVATTSSFLPRPPRKR